MTPAGRIATCGIIGSGTAAGAVAPALVEAGVTVVAVSGGNARTAALLASAVDAQVMDMESIPSRVDCTILAVPDGAISSVAAELARGDVAGRAIVHLAGRLGLEPLSAVRRRGALVGKMHPISSLAGGPARLRGIVWGVEADAELLPRIMDLIDRMGGRGLSLDGVSLDLYHAAAVVASNLLVALLDTAAELWSCSGLTEDAMPALLPLARGTLDNVAKLGLGDALTGPISRGDDQAVRAQLAAVHQCALDVEPIYRALALRTLMMAVGSGRSNPAAEARMRAVLAEDRMLQ